MQDKRVILVGKTGLDAALRSQSLVEVVRVQTALEAVGEVSIAARESRGSVVVLGPEWERAMVLGGGSSGIGLREDGGEGGTVGGGRDQEEPVPGLYVAGSVHGPTKVPARPIRGLVNGTLSKFVEGLRLIDPKVSVIGIEEAGRDSMTDEVRADATGQPSVGTPSHVLPTHIQLDAKIPVYSSTQAVIDTVEMVYRKRHANPAREEASFLSGRQVNDAKLALNEGGSQGTHAEVTSGASMSGGVGDSALLELLMRGKEVLACAVRLIHERTGGEVEYIAANQSTPSPSGSVVERGGVVIGTLRGGDPRVCDAHAQWLTKWLKASDQHRQLRTAAFTDALTGAWNRRYFVKHLESSLEVAKTLRRDLLVLVFDVDNFKRYNDQFGHHVGDEILTEVARLMGSVVRPSDRVCRIGGDEFAVVFFDPQGPRRPGSTNRVSVLEMAERFRAKVASHTFPKLAGIEGAALTISGGMAVYPWDGATAEALVDRADQLAREGKREGKNIIRFGDVHLQDAE